MVAVAEVGAAQCALASRAGDTGIYYRRLVGYVMEDRERPGRAGAFEATPKFAAQALARRDPVCKRANDPRP